MKPLFLQSSCQLNYTFVSNRFLDTYMPAASGEFVKIYLYLLRCLSGNAAQDNCNALISNTCSFYNSTEDCFCISFLADKFNLTENDVCRALRYWENQGLLKLSFCGGDLTGITVTAQDAYPVIPAVPSSAPAQNAYSAVLATPSSVPPQKLATASPISKQPASSVLPEGSEPALQTEEEPVLPKRPRYTAKQLEKFTHNEDISTLLYVIQKYLGRALTTRETNTVIYFYDGLGMSIDLISLLYEKCISNNHSEIRYIEKVALSWAQKGITTVEDAKNELLAHSQLSYDIMNAFGITGRTFAASERDYISAWSDTFCADMIIEACNRTMLAIHTPSFQYADSILNKWKTEGIFTMDAVHDNDRQFNQQKASKETPHKSSTVHTKASSDGKAGAKNNKFNNFPQRDYDYDELERKLVVSNRLI